MRTSWILIAALLAGCTAGSGAKPATVADKAAPNLEATRIRGTGARFEQLREHLWCELPTPHLVTMRQLAQGEQVPHEGACRAVAKELAEIEAGKTLITFDDLPRFLRRKRETS